MQESKQYAAHPQFISTLASSSSASALTFSSATGVSLSTSWPSAAAVTLAGVFFLETLCFLGFGVASSPFSSPSTAALAPRFCFRVSLE